MADDYTRDHFRWLHNVAADRGLAPGDFRLAFLIGEHFNRESLDCWPAHATLAAKVGADQRSVRRGVDRLVRAGHLSVRLRAGRNHANVYHREFTQDKIALSDLGQKCPQSAAHGTGAVATADTGGAHSGRPRPTNLLLEQLQILEGREARKLWFGKNQSAFDCHVTTVNPAWDRWCQFLGFIPPTDRRFGWNFPAPEPPIHQEAPAEPRAEAQP